MDFTDKVRRDPESRTAPVGHRFLFEFAADLRNGAATIAPRRRPSRNS